MRCNAHISQMLWSHVLYVCYTAIHTFNVYVCSIIADSFLKVLGFRLNLLAITLTPGGLQVDHGSSNPTFANICHLHAICQPCPLPGCQLVWTVSKQLANDHPFEILDVVEILAKLHRSCPAASTPRLPKKKNCVKNIEKCKHELTVL